MWHIFVYIWLINSLYTYKAFRIYSELIHSVCIVYILYTLFKFYFLFCCCSSFIKIKFYILFSKAYMYIYIYRLYLWYKKNRIKIRTTKPSEFVIFNKTVYLQYKIKISFSNIPENWLHNNIIDFRVMWYYRRVIQNKILSRSYNILVTYYFIWKLVNIYKLKMKFEDYIYIYRKLHIVEISKQLF